ncbi:MAG: HDIG domain-containing protein [Candidatus Cloacimonas sp.]|jgi:putative nucleotidyltransferase with HDIG domain|nr:HDIG domain-containing protein [Candidatus Cloacimonas sp.]
MNSKHIIYSILTAFVIVGLYQIFAVGKYNYPEFRLKAGQVSEAEVLAPFDFPIMKPSTELSAAREKALSILRKPYDISEEAMFEAMSMLDGIFAVLFANNNTDDLQVVVAELQRAGYTLSPEALSFSSNTRQQDRVYEELRANVTAIYRQGIYELPAPDSVLIVRTDNMKMENVSRFLSPDEAVKLLIAKTPEAKTFLEELAPQLIKPNLTINEERLNELSQRSIGMVPESEGVVLQNEVIVRKNARVSPDDIRKLDSLQEAYRSRNVSKSPMQEMLLTFGLLLFIFIAVSLANHYFGVQSKEDKIMVADFLPLNLGFVVLVLFATISNHVLGYNNLVIPFAMMAIAATILVSFEYGVLYSICSLLVISPFLNWETYTPVVLILSTLMCLILIRRQNAYHEYLMIWIYLTLSTMMVIVSISLYKSDPLISVLRSLGFGLVSASISISGIMLIVPYYERKWNRATKQTLLELLDFNHPLLKKLATEAVGTYHHSLIVGNLCERAAEAIGANPLLARVGSYYHDIGKIINTEIFTENNEDSSDIHDDMKPAESARLIRNHVTEGIALARKYKIPQPVIDIIMQHHGDSYIRYFLDKASKDDPDTMKSNYQYPGPRPQSKEAALVMIADIVESTTKAKNIANEADIAKIIDDTINRLLANKQLDEAPLTIKDLKIVKESFLPVLESIYRKRLDYPEPPKNV